MKMPNRLFFVGCLVGLAIAAGSVIAFPRAVHHISIGVWRTHIGISHGVGLQGLFRLSTRQGQADEGLPVPRVPEGPPVGILNQRLQRLDGDETSLSEFRHKILFVNYWATWCAPCVEEMASIQSLAEHFGDADVAFVLISEETPDTVREFVEEHDLTVPVYTTSESEGSFIAGSIPTTFVLDENRWVVFSRTGAAQWDDESSTVFLERLLKDEALQTASPVQPNAP